MAFTSLSSLVNAAGIPAGQPGSLLQIPSAPQAAELASTTSVVSWLFPADLPPEEDMVASVAAFNQQVAEYASAKMGRLNTELPIMNAAATAEKQIAESDALIAGTASDLANVNASIDEAFKSSASPCLDLAGPGGPFSALLGAGEKLSEAAAAIGGIFNDLTTDAIESLSGLLVDPPTPIATTAAELMAQLKAASAEKLEGLRDALYPEGGMGAFDDIAEALSDAASSIRDTVGGITSSFTSMVSTEMAAFNAALNKLTSINFVNLLNSSNPCINAIMGQTVNPAMTDQSTLAILANPRAFNIPVKTAIAGAASGQRLATLSPEVVKAPLPPKAEDATNVYTNSEMSALRTKLRTDFEEPAKAAQATAARELETIEQWKVDNQYVAKREAAGATASTPNGTSKDPAVIAAWLPVYRQYTQMSTAYNSGALVERNRLVELHQEAYKEYGLRGTFGKFPYTKMDELGMVFADEFRTTLLDTGI